MSAEAESDRPGQPPRDVGDVLDEAEMDDTLDDTFPASDPPSWTLGVDESRREHPLGTTDDESEEWR
ncbi:MAG: hypothetical protein ABS36_07135 [Acidobacteria bacterium SCN 69-37]|nr:MAG: hypothetical protein ABS36_07135 [Acidobacteria bacterium SCN 69-37]